MRTVGPGSPAIRRAQSDSSTGHSERAVRAQREQGGGLRGAVRALLKVPSALLCAPALRPAPLAQPAPLCQPRARPFGPQAPPPPPRRLAGRAASRRGSRTRRRGI